MTRARELAQTTRWQDSGGADVVQASAFDDALAEVRRLELALVQVRALLDPAILAADEDTALTEARRIARAALKAAA